MTSAPIRATAGTYTGTWQMVRFYLHRDRIKVPAWVLGIALTVAYYTNALPVLFGSAGGLKSAAGFLTGPIGAVFGGPGFGADNLTLERFFVGEYGLYVMASAALMSLLLVSRHTRLEEQTGRSELILAGPVGRSAPLTATLILAVISNVGVSVLVPLVMIGKGYAAADSFLFGAGVGAVGLVFAGVAAITVQVTEYSRAASGLAGATLGVFFLIRAAGDLLEKHGSLLSWFSPLAWSQQTRPFVDPRWWPLLLSVAFAGVTISVGYRLAERRDYGAALIRTKPGPPRAGTYLHSPLAVAFRLQRAAIFGWGAALLIAGFAYGVITKPVVDGLGSLSQDMLSIFGGAENLVDGYLASMAVFEAVLVSVFVVLGIQSVRTEEITGRVEPLLASATDRKAWFGANLIVIAGGAVGLLIATGLGTAIGAVIGTGEIKYLWLVVLGHLAYAPAMFLILGVAALLFGFLPRAVPAAWALVFYGLVVGFFAPLLNLPRWAIDLSPLDHISRVPGNGFGWLPVIILTIMAGVVAALGIVAFRRRDLTVT
jgi:ABC-2 type transport system permease protein